MRGKFYAMEGDLRLPWGVSGDPAQDSLVYCSGDASCCNQISQMTYQTMMRKNAFYLWDMGPGWYDTMIT